MINQVQETKMLFSKELKRRCTEKYPKFPSNEKLARDLCLTSKYSLRVSRETIRKWLKGDTFPDLDCLLHLINWLELDMTNVFIANPHVTEKIKFISNHQAFPINSVDTLPSDQVDLIIGLFNIFQKNTLKDE
jgi:hypothetical protein